MMLPPLRRSFHSPRPDQVDDLVRQIAERSVSLARSRLRANAGTMSPAELRGYVRARAHSPVRELTGQIATQYDCCGKTLDSLVARALERTVHLIIRQAMLQPLPIVRSSPQPARRVG